MLALLGGVLILAGLLLLVYLFVNTEPAKLARALKWAAIGVGVALFGFLLFSERFAFLWLPLTLGLPYLRRARSLFAGFRSATTGGGGQSSTVATRYLRMRLDHETGAMSGTVLAGRFAGARLDELGEAELVELLRECRADDEEGARLVEAYLDRVHPQWRDRMHGARGAASGRADDEMSIAEAYEILGLEPGASEAAIRAAYHRLMMQLHPDHGGTDYLATKINRARDVLLNR
ncbi:MAG TPA: DnaJ domain-containing protein, partial [Stellaceae bacterium]|nr:DnaJ domain-containing protein [Stellaceae bacterium]